ncbi:hypothetical protein H2199_008849 [Coniosporium tulheliwenetii]|uniref:Uncharacterized protein n=1 Tax=Coniosporium tulheliwenetii TaxID=3383036 RepID=A0ACC2YGS0_9PEZI|nr:hypothetical protein H2199_008849 [Cladosporium sp. JES 115]
MPKRQAGQPPKGLVAADAPAAKRARVEDVPRRTGKAKAATTDKHSMKARGFGETAATANTGANGDADDPSDCHVTSSPLVLSQACNRHISSAPVYKPLDPSRREIRLLTLAGGQFSDDIHCSLSTVSLDDEPVYEALSYVWGDPNITRTIILQWTLQQATTNLEAALRRLRYRNRPRVLWVDAVCINQKDVLERQKQVLLMGDLYRNASVVLCWLGEKSEDSALAFDAFETWPQGPEIHWDPDETLGMDPRTSGIEYAFAVERLSGRPYFYRLWIIYGVLGIANDTVHVVPDYSVPVPLVYEQFTATTMETYQTLDVLSQVLPCSAASSTQTPAGLPSWAPDWSAKLKYTGNSNYAQGRFRGICCYNSSMGSKAGISQPNRGRLAARGVLLGTIARLGGAVDDEMSAADAVEFIESGIHFAMLETLPNRSYPVSSDAAYDSKTSTATSAACQTTYQDALWMTLCGSVVPDSFILASELDMSKFANFTRTTEPWRYRSFFDSRWESWNEYVDTGLPSAVGRADVELMQFSTQFGQAMAMRRLFVSDPQHEWLGSAPMDAKVGDTIAILAGGKVPYILRQKEVDGERVFQFMGDAYVHGIMDGEGMALGEMEEIVLV